MKDKILNIPSLSMFNNDMDLFDKFLENEGYPPFTFGGNLNYTDFYISEMPNLISIDGNLILNRSGVTSLGNLEHVGGMLMMVLSDLQDMGKLNMVVRDLNLNYTNVKNLGGLKFVGGYLSLRRTKITKLEDFGILDLVGGDLILDKESTVYDEKELRSRINILGEIMYL